MNRPTESRRSRCALYAGLCAAAVLLWQSLTVRYNYQGAWTALFYTGSSLRQPPALASERLYVLKNSAGYDGQFYHYIAHDPLLRRGLAAYVDNPRLRWRRILVPGLAFLAAGGRSDWIDPAYRAIVLAFVFLGAYWLARYCSACGLHPAWGVAFVLVPAAAVSIDRMTVDVALAALGVAFVLYAPEGRSWRIFPVLVLAPLVRETGMVLPAAYCLAMLLRRRWARAAAAAAMVLPAMAWAFYVARHTDVDGTAWTSWVPFKGLVLRSVSPLQYALPGRWLVVAAGTDYLAVLGVWLAIGISILLIVRRKLGPVELAAALFTLLAAFLSRPDIWSETYAFGRTLSPMLVFLALLGVAARSWWMLLPILMVLPRIGLQIMSQVPAILSGHT